jgi:ketosteroid isomerase-like protein
MPDSNSEIFKQYLEALNREDFKAARGALDKSVEWWGSPYTPTPYRGHKGVRQFWSDWRKGWDDFHAEVEEVVPGMDQLVAVVRDRGRGQGSGLPIERRTALALRFRAGKITWSRVCGSKDEAMKALGMR